MLLKNTSLILLFFGLFYVATLSNVYASTTSKIIFSGSGDNPGYNLMSTINPDGTGITTLGTNYINPQISPDGNKILFEAPTTNNSCFKNARTDIFVMNSDGSDIINLTSSFANCNNQGASWSADGSQIVFDSNNELYVMNSDGSNITNIGVSGGYPEWSPTSNKIAFINTTTNVENELFTVNSDGSDITDLGIGPVLSLPSWSHDGSKIAYWTISGGIGNINIVNADGSNNTVIFQGIAGINGIGWSPDDTTLAYAAVNDINIQPAGLFTIPVIGGTPTEIYTDSNSQDWANDYVTWGNIQNNQDNSLVTALNAGGATQGNYVADTDYSGGTTYTSSASVDTTNVSNPAPQAVYQTVRYGNNFSYTIPNLTANGTYTVRIHFNELYWTAAGQRVFNVAINGDQVLSHFDIYQAAGGTNKAIVEQFPATADSNGNVTIQFTGVTDNAMVNGIELYNGTLPSPTPTPTPTPVTSASINAGGTTAGDYQADNGYTGGTTYSTSTSIDTTGVTNPAPESVYQTVRYGNSFSYTVPTYSPNTNYTVRLDFSEPYWNTAGSREFNVSINGTQDLSNFDVYQEAGGQNKAVSEQFTTTTDSSGLIHIQFNSVVDNAMVSGIEVSQQ